MIKSASPAKEIIAQMVKQSGISKKLAAEILHAIAGIIEEGLKKDGEVRVKGLGTFRLRWTRGKMGRNLKTGERVEIPSHNRVIFIPEQAFKEFINRDNRLLNYKIIPSAEQVRSMEEAIPETEIIEHYPYQEQEQHQAQYQFQEQTQPESVPESKTEPEHEPEPIIMPGPETEPEPEIPARKRRIHWIIPVAASVIIILSLVFYFRNFHTSRPSAVSSQQKEVDSRQLTVDSSRQSSVVSQQSSVVSQQSAVSRQQSEVSSQQAIEPTHNSELITPNSELSTKNSALISPGAHLFQLAREIYGNPYLWVLIYKENLDKIPDPDMVISGSELVIPNLEGKPDRLTRNDSVAVSEGYRLVYEYFKTKDDPRTKDFFRAMKRYTPK